MEKVTTDRGFELIRFKDEYGSLCSLQKSSLATADAVWLGVNDADPKIMVSEAAKFGIRTEETVGWIPYPIPVGISLTTRMHLTQAQVAELLPHLQKFVDTGEI